MMAEEGKPPIITTAARSWADGFRAVAAMPLTAAIGLACLMAVAWLGQFALDAMLPPAGSPFRASAADALPMQLVHVVRGLVQCVLLTPFCIAVHRFVLLHQVTKGYPIAPSNARFLRYAGFGGVIYLLFWLPPLLDRAVHLPGDLQVCIFVILNIAVVAIVVRRVVLPPAIAVDAADLGWRRARLLIKGHCWRAFLILLCVALPFLLLVLPMHYFYEWGIVSGETGAVAYWLEARVAEFVAVCVFAAAAAHLYRAFDPTLGREPSPPTTIAPSRAIPSAGPAPASA